MEWRGEWGNGEGRQTWLTGPWRKTEIRICDFSCFFLFFAADPQRSVDVPLRQIEYGPLPQVGQKDNSDTNTRSICSELSSEKAVFFFCSILPALKF